MTNSLIPVFNGSISNASVQLCNARELHTFLESKYQYTDWVKTRISEYGFVQDEDYIIVTERTNGRPRKEYHITLDMGKELAMVERNEKGRQIRKYFIECERQVLQKTAIIAQIQAPEFKPQMPTLNNVEQDILIYKINDLNRTKGLNQVQVYTDLCLEFNVQNITQIKAIDFDNAYRFLLKVENRN